MPDVLPIVKNWRAHETGATWFEAYEVPLFTDARFVGEVHGECGPYWFLNTVPIQEGVGVVRTACVLRCHFVADLRSEYGSIETNADSYHGGFIFDEVAALSSLVLGVRIRAGGHTREFKVGDSDPLGRPCAWSHVPEPVLHVRDPARPVLPSVLGSRDLTELHALNGVTRLTSNQSIALIRAARFYQDALWLAESEQNLSWLMLVSALEAAAQSWTGEKGNKVDRLREAHPRLFQLASESEDPTFVSRLAELVAHTLKATQKFIDFGLHFLPPVPEKRPVEFARIVWTPDSWARILRQIYSYRSTALHEGAPFPRPMWDAPFYFENKEPPSEKGTLGLAAHVGNATWNATDLPVNLNLFAIVVRQMLLAWLKEMQVSSPK